MRFIFCVEVKVFVVVYCLSIALSSQLSGQSYPLGLNPASLNWKQIDTEAVEVIFPENAESQAQRVANLAQVLYDSNYYSLGPKKNKVSIILQNQTVRSNGFVTIGPYRSEFFTNPPQYGTLGNNWIDLLAIHEYRHIEQFNNTKRGIPGVVSILFGQTAWAATAGMALPRWFWEGDAVFYETALTRGGRGRLPEFENRYRALLASHDKVPGYEKASATSLKQFVPNHYNLGYLMTTSLRGGEGENIWNTVVKDAVEYDGVFYPLSNSLKSITGSRTPKLYRETFKKLQDQWKNELKDKEITTGKTISDQPKKTFINYHNPTFIEEGLLVVEKAGFNQIPTFYLLNEDGTEKKLFHPGFYDDDNAVLNYNHGKLIWTQRTFDERWANENYSVIMQYDLHTKEKKQLTKNTRYFAPDWSPDGLRIVAVHSPDNYNFEIHVLDRFGTLLKRLPFDKDYHYAFPTWMDDEQILVVVRKGEENAVARIDLSKGNMELLTAFQTENISYPVYREPYVIYNSFYNGTDNIYAYDLNKSKHFQITSTRFGATQPDVSPSGRMLTYAEYTARGYDVKKMPFKPAEWKPVESRHPFDFIEPLAIDNGIMDKVPDKNYEIADYNSFEGLVLHSWTPAFIPPNAGITVRADNKLTTMSASAFYNYNNNENVGTYGATVTYGGWYPALEVEYSRSDRDRDIPVYQEAPGTEDSISVPIVTNAWTENVFSIGAALPFNLTGDHFFRKFWITNSYQLINVDYDNDQPGTDETFGAWELELDFFNLRRMALQQLKPRFGQSINLNYQTTLGSDFNASHSLTLRSIFYFPGLFRNHSFFINADYQSEPFASEYKFRDNFFYARGYGSVVHDRVNRFGFNYSLPLLYPDIPIGPLFFIKRVSSNFFFDISESTIDPLNSSALTAISPRTFDLQFSFNDRRFRSAGVEVSFDFRFIRLLDINMGFRYSRLLDDITGLNSNQFDLIISTISI
ncbi:MAG TPA: hypothetical protein ACFCUD_12205 [Cyclobacteriaceae bacterium]